MTSYYKHLWIQTPCNKEIPHLTQSYKIVELIIRWYAFRFCNRMCYEKILKRLDVRHRIRLDVRHRILIICSKMHDSVHCAISYLQEIEIQNCILELQMQHKSIEVSTTLYWLYFSSHMLFIGLGLCIESVSLFSQSTFWFQLGFARLALELLKNVYVLT